METLDLVRDSHLKVSAVIAEILRRERVDTIFGYPRNAVLEQAAIAGIRTVIVRQERVGIHMADALSRLTRGRRMGVFCMQHGPGAENAYGGVAQAYSESVPVLVLPQGYARRIAHVPDNFNSTLSMARIAKHIEPLTSAAETVNVMRRAFTQLRNGRPRPVVVELPWDVLAETISPPIHYEAVVQARYAPDESSVRQAADALVGVARPLIYAGQGIHWAEAYEELVELAELLAAPVCTSLPGKSAFDETHRLALGSGGAAVPATVRHFIDHADVILGIGCSFSETAFGVSIPPGKIIVHATLEPSDLNKSVAATHALIGDARLTLRMLINHCRERLGSSARDDSAVCREIREVEGRWMAQWEPLLGSNETPLSPYRVLWDLQQTVDVANTIITHDAGSPRDQLSPFWKTRSPMTYLGWGKSTQLGYGFGLAMGAKLACPQKLCINVWGDAAIGFTGMDFETAVRERLPVLSVLLNNSCMAIELDQMPVATQKYRATDISGDYAALARALGGYGERITAPQDIIPALRRGIAQVQQGTPALLEFITRKEQRASRL
jgi:acetolactate synthase-1/2/3 large subunit